MKGIDFIVSWDDAGMLHAIAGGRSDDIQTDCETIPVSSSVDSEWEHVIAGRKSWSIQVGWLLLNANSVADVLKVGETYTIRFGNKSGGGVEGTAILKTCRITAQISSLVQGSFKFQGNGVLRQAVHVQG